MASQYTGSGKFVKIMGGKLSAGVDNTTYYEAYAETRTISSKTYYGIKLSAGCLSLQNISEIAIGDVRGYTGLIGVYTNFYYPFDPLIWDASWWTTWINNRNSWLAYKTLAFENGILVGVT